MSNDNPELREKLAEYAHEAWSGWMKYLFEKGEFEVFTAPDGTTETRWIMPAWAVRRWGRQLQTPYADLPEEEKESDRTEADTMLALMQATISQRVAEAKAWEEWHKHSREIGDKIMRQQADYIDKLNAEIRELKGQLQAPSPTTLPAEVAEAMEQLLTMMEWLVEKGDFYKYGSYAVPLAVVKNWLRATNTRRDDAEDRKGDYGKV